MSRWSVPIFPDGIVALDEIIDTALPVKAFYDIDTPITCAALRAHGRADYIESRQIPELDIYFSFTGGPMLREIEARFGARQAVPLYCSFDPEKYRRTPLNRDFACDLSYMGTYAPDRQPKLHELLGVPAQRLSARRFIVAGPQYPKKTVWPANVCHISHLSPMWHPEFYSSSRFTLNVTRRDMVMAGYSPLGSAIRSSCLRRDHYLGQLARARFVLQAGCRDLNSDRIE